MTPYYVQLVSLLPDSDIHPQKMSAKFPNPHQRITKWRDMASSWPRGGMLIGQNEDMNSSTVWQNHLTKYCLTHYYVQLVSLLPASDINPQKVSVEFVNPHERISK